jgi:hypothetical protein
MPSRITKTISVILHHRGHDGSRVFVFDRSDASMHSFVLILKGDTVLRLIGGATITGIRA